MRPGITFRAIVLTKQRNFIEYCLVIYNECSDSVGLFQLLFIHQKGFRNAQGSRIRYHVVMNLTFIYM